MAIRGSAATARRSLGYGLTPQQANRALAAVLLLIGLCVFQAACGSGGGGSTPSGGTPAGSYVITVNADGGANQHSTSVTLNVL